MRTLRTLTATAAMAVGLSLAGTTGAHSQTVQVVRGDQVASIAETRQAGVRVFRGAPSAPTAPSDAADGLAEQRVDIVAAGARLWFVDRATGNLSVCGLVATTQVGEQRIDCHRGALVR